MKKKLSVKDFQHYKEIGQKFTWSICYDYTMASIVDESKTEMLLVGDSLGNVIMGYGSTIPVTLDDMIHHIKAVVKGAPNTFVVGDMPFGTYNASCEQAILTANRIMQEGGCDCVKLEGGAAMAETIRRMVEVGIPVMGHIGLTPQSASSFGGFKMQGDTPEGAAWIVANEKAIAQACVRAILGYFGAGQEGPTAGTESPGGTADGSAGPTAGTGPAARWYEKELAQAVAAGITDGELLLTDCPFEELDAVIAKMRQMGMEIEPTADGVLARRSCALRGVDVTTQPFPGFPTDMQAQIMALMCLSEGSGVISETIFENRFMHVQELVRMGADIRLSGHTAVIRGVQRLTGAPVMASDLRASASLVLAGLAAKGTTTVQRIYHLDRGYERIENKLNAVGARISREAE